MPLRAKCLIGFFIAGAIIWSREYHFTYLAANARLPRLPRASLRPCHDDISASIDAKTLQP